MGEKYLYTQDDFADIDLDHAIAKPGEYPYTRGIHKTMYVGHEHLWTMRQFAGFGLPEDTNLRFRMLWAEGETGFSTAFDMPTLVGYDSDDPHSLGEVGKGGVAVDSLEDMIRLFRGIPIGRPDVSVSMTINAPACVLLAMYYALGRRRRIAPSNYLGTIQNDILKEFTAQNELIVPHAPAMKLFVDTVEFCSKFMPKYNPVSISGYHIREKGSTAVQELAFTLADGIAYVDACVKRGMNVDDFAPRFSFFFDVHFHGESGFFHEIAKFRAARRMWARIMRERFHAKNERSLKLRTHAQTAGVSLTWQQNKNNIARATLQALAAVLSGVQSLHVDAYDEQDSLPSQEAALLALRTQQIIAHETGVTDVVDPLGGSYYLEGLTNKMEEEAWAYIKRIDDMGGMVRAVEKDFPKNEIEIAAGRFMDQVERGEVTIVGVNKFAREGERQNIEFRGNKRAEAKQRERLAKLRVKRNNAAVQKALDEVSRAAEREENVMLLIVVAVEALATEGEIVRALQKVYGEYRGY